MLPSYRTTVTQPTNSPSRRLSRTLSMRTSAADTRDRDYYSSASVGADRRRISELSSPSSYSSSLLGTQESIKKDYLPPTRRSLHMLDSRNTSNIPKYKGSSASDSGDYSYRSRVTDYDRVLPPLPYSASTRKESLRSLYARQRSLDSSASSYGGSRRVYSRIQEEVQERPHHSSSVPLVGGSTESKAAHLHTRKDEYKTEISSNSNPKSTSTSDKCENKDTSTSLKDKNDSKTIVTQEPSPSTTSKKGRQIPSLLRLRSSSASREVSKENKDSKEIEGKLPRSSSMSNSTPDRSVLGKFLRQSSESREVPSQENEEGKKKVRKISRFLRPDFYDTPREDSIYAKEQDAKKAAEAEAKLKRRKSLKKTESSSSQTQVADNNRTAALAPCNSDSSAVNDAAQNASKKHKEKDTETKETKFANNKKNSNVSETRKESSSPAFEKQCSTSPTKSGFLHSLEKKLIKFKSSGDDIPVVTSSGKSRIDKAIHSLREKSLTPRGSDIITTESHLLKRAVSVDDCSTAVGGANSPTNTGTKLGNRVTSVLGLFRKYEDAPTKGTQGSPPRTSVLSRLRRTQSVYAGSQSDGVLTGSENETSQKKSPQDSQHLKKTHSNSSLGSKNINKNSNQADVSKQKIPSVGTKAKKSPEKSVKVTKRLKENINMNTVSIHPIVKTKENTSNTTEPVMKEIANPPALLVHDSHAVMTANCNSNENVTNATSPPQEIVNVLSDVPKTFNEEQVVESINRLSKQESQDQEITFLAVQNHAPNKSNIGEQPTENMGMNTNIIGSRIPSISVANKSITGLTVEGNLNNEVLSLMPPDVLPGDVSPTDELESLDSWSVCSDFECHDFPMSPILSPGDETESVGDRIRRKSFYTRFNDIKKKHRKPSLTSLGTLSSSYREPNSFYAKKRHHSSELALQNSNLKPHRSKSLSTDNGYGVLPERKSPVPQKGSEGATPLMNGCDDLVNGSLAEEHCSQPDDSQTNGGSRERLRLPRHFNSNVNLSYNVPSKQNVLRRASDTCLSRSTEANIGGTFPKSRLPTPVNRVSKVCTTSDNESQLGSSKLDTLLLHGKYKRCNSENAVDPQLQTAENQDGSAVVCEQVSPH